MATNNHFPILIAVIILINMGCTRSVPSDTVHTTSQPPNNPAVAAVPTSDVTPAPEPEPVTASVVDARGSVAIEVLPQYNRILQNVKGELNVLLKLDGKEAPDVERQPIHLAIVIDRSGSMSGDKIASVKIAALELLKRLIPEDRVTLISYANNVTTHTTRQLMNDVGRSLVKDKILGISAGGLTALGPATINAEKIMNERADTTQTLSHILLLSDGLANVGESNPTRLGQVCATGFSQGVSISTLGVGLDYNEDLMTKMADEGGGQYHYVRDDNMIAGVLDDELKGLMATVARDIFLEVIPSEGFTVSAVLGYAAEITENNTIIRIGSLRSGQNRDVMLTLSHNEVNSTQPALGTLSLQFTDVLNQNTKENIELHPAVFIAQNENEHSESENIEVTVRLAEVQSSEELKLAARAVDRGDFVQAETVLNDSIASLEVQAQKTPDVKLEMQMKDLKQAKADLEMAKTSEASKKDYVKQRKSTAYKKSKQTQGRKSTFDKISKKKQSRRGSKVNKMKKTSDAFSY